VSPITVEVSPWTLTWKGGRLGDIGHVEYPGKAIHCIQVGHWDHQLDRLSREPDAGALQLVLGEWISEHGAEYARNVLPYL
jgi:hypothetical protein